MKVKLKISYLNHPAGSVVDLDGGIAETLVFVNRAEAITEEKKCDTAQRPRQQKSRSA